MNSSRRCVIIGASDIKNDSFVRSILTKNDYYVFCDAGLRHIKSLGVSPDLIVGDFDSHKNPKLPIETIVLPREKDDTDTFFAVKEAIKRGFSDFLLIGVIGKRLDHTLANLSILLYLHSKGCSAEIVDEYSLMEIADEKEHFVSDRYPYFSLMNINGDAHSVTIKNAKYELCDAEILSHYQYGVSNETIKGKTAIITVKDSKMLLIKIFDKNC